MAKYDYALELVRDKSKVDVSEARHLLYFAYCDFYNVPFYEKWFRTKRAKLNAERLEKECKRASAILEHCELTSNDKDLLNRILDECIDYLNYYNYLTL